MSMIERQMLPSACEVDIAGVVGMYALQLAGGSPAHLSTGTTITAAIPRNASSSTAATGPRTFCPTSALATAPILAHARRRKHLRRAGRPHACWSVTFGRVSTTISAITLRGRRRIHHDPLKTSARARGEGAGLPGLMHVICRNGFEHHAAMNRSIRRPRRGSFLAAYLGWRVYHHHTAIGPAACACIFDAYATFYEQ